MPLSIRPNAMISLPEKEIRAFCERNHITKLLLFGSVVRDEFGPESDIDVLVEFEPGHVPGFAFFALQDELTTMLGREVDLNTWNFLSPSMHGDVTKESVMIYGEA